MKLPSYDMALCLERAGLSLQRALDPRRTLSEIDPVFELSNQLVRTLRRRVIADSARFFAAHPDVELRIRRARLDEADGVKLTLNHAKRRKDDVLLTLEQMTRGG